MPSHFIDNESLLPSLVHFYASFPHFSLTVALFSTLCSIYYRNNKVRKAIVQNDHWGGIDTKILIDSKTNERLLTEGLDNSSERINGDLIQAPSGRELVIGFYKMYLRWHSDIISMPKLMIITEYLQNISGKIQPISVDRKSEGAVGISSFQGGLLSVKSSFIALVSSFPQSLCPSTKAHALPVCSTTGPLG